MDNQMSGDLRHSDSLFVFNRRRYFTMLSITYVMIVVTVFVIIEMMFAMNPTIFLGDSEYPAVKTSSFFETLPGTNMTKADLIQEIHGDYVCTFLALSLIVYAAAFLLVTFVYITHEILFEITLSRSCMLSQTVTGRLRTARDAFLGRTCCRLRRLQRVSRHQYGLHRVIAHKIPRPSSYEVRANLDDFLLSRVIRMQYQLHVDAILWLHDLIKTVDFMHSKRLFHLNLQPKAVFIHWLQDGTSQKYKSIFEDCQTNTLRHWVLHKLKEAIRRKSQDPEARIVLGDLTHAVRCADGKVNAGAVAVPEHYKPPECRVYGDEYEVDASKVDAWGIGIIAFEILTGGFIKIRTDQIERGSPGDELLQQAFDKRHFNNALFAMYDLKNAFRRQRMFDIKFQGYCLDQKKFATDCYDFVGGLLEVEPNKRISLKRALELPLMNKVHRDLKDIYYVDYSF